ncbi:MAG: 30S ribosomal protein S12 methylthiotransferase RimO [Clostridia bacterium]|nr:30S ribosomal protein S12 methylthiotransferase RimO [Clostridia bacterium]
MKVGAISLGCDKNRVDTERLLGFVLQAGHRIVNDVDEADAVIVNTCAFLQSAVKESLDTVFEARSHKNVKYLIVAGCLPMRYLSELTAADGLKEADALLDNSCYDRIGEVLTKLEKGEKVVMTNAGGRERVESRVVTTPYHYAYLKVSDGCDNKCTFCAIPGIRGAYASTPIESLVKEADGLVGQGVKELILVAQDVTRYGSDLYGEPKLIDLLRALIALPVEKIRLLYCYPDMCTDELIDFIDSEPKIAKYIDMPMQHASDGVLKRMNRRDNRRSLLDRIAYIRGKKSGIAIRSTFMVGFPQETEEEFEDLLSFLEEARLDNVGFFAYSKEEGTPAARMKGQVPQSVKKQRLKKAEALQSAIAEQKAKEKVGTVLYVTYDGIDYDKQCFYGHTERLCPDVDAKVYFTSDEPIEIGESYPVLVKKTKKLDLYGQTVRSKQ